MKKLLLVSLVFFAVNCVSAQTVIDFETGTLPVLAEDGYEIVGNPAEINVAIADNPELSGNSSAKCLTFTLLQAQPAYAGPKFDFSGQPFTVYGDPNNDNKAILSCKIRKSAINGIVRLRVMGDANTNYTSVESVETVDQWTIVSFDISDRIGQEVDVFLIQADLLTPRPANVVVQVDDVRLPDTDISTAISDEITSLTKIINENNLIKINSETVVSEVVVFDMTGRVVSQLQGNEIKQINIANLPGGLYIVKAKAEGKVYTEKVLKR